MERLEFDGPARPTASVRDCPEFELGCVRPEGTKIVTKSPRTAFTRFVDSSRVASVAPRKVILRLLASRRPLSPDREIARGPDPAAAGTIACLQGFTSDGPRLRSGSAAIPTDRTLIKSWLRFQELVSVLARSICNRVHSNFLHRVSVVSGLLKPEAWSFVQSS